MAIKVSMKKLTTFTLILFVLLFSPFCYSGKPSGSVYMEGQNKIGVVLCHGKGKYPTWKVVDPLRKGINEKLGFSTLSIQMPNDNKNWKQYDADFHEAYSRIDAAVRFLRQEVQVKKVFLIGHSMGSRMASSYLRENVNYDISGLVIAGCRNNGGYPFNCMQNVRGLNLPILDIWGGRNRKDSLSASERKKLRLNAYTQVEISGANHTFDEYEDKLVSVVTDWLQAQ